MDTNNNNDTFASWLETEMEKIKTLVHSPDTWTRKNADTRMDDLRAAAKVWQEFKAAQQAKATGYHSPLS